MGHEVTAETRAKISEASSGRIASAETRTRMSESRRKHGHGGRYRGLTRTPEYNAWDGLIQRCTNPNQRGWMDYGGRGITVCDRWRESFPAFLADMGEKPEPKAQYSIDRIDNDRGYEPDNCKWATRSEQQKNRPRFNPDKRSKRRPEECCATCKTDDPRTPGQFLGAVCEDPYHALLWIEDDH